MPYAGNPRWIKGGPSPNPAGTTRPDRLAARGLALAIRELVRPEEIATYLLEVASGKDPNAVDGKGYIPPDWNQRLAAMRMLLERGYGNPPQHVIIDAEVRAATTLTVGVIDFGKLTAEQLHALASIDIDALAPPEEQPIEVIAHELPPGTSEE